MIPHKNFCVGALGRLQNIGGSRIYTTPHTVSVPSEYSINVSYNVQGDLVAHSLDGRLWFYRRSRRLGIIALRWNAKKGELEYATAQNLSNNNDVILACGLDWILTNNNIFLVSDEEPYIRSTGLFDFNIPDTFLYSLLRVGNVGTSGIDQLTGEAWGKRDDNGNSNGTGYFSKTTHLLYPAGSHTFEHCYSLLPAVGDWQIFENFLVHRPDAESIGNYNYMQAVRPLIPLEFNNGTAVYGTGYNFDHRGIQLVHRNGEIFGRGFQNIGKVSLLPAVFGEDGSVQEFYLYISPDFQRDPDSMQYDEWQNVVLGALGDNSLYGVMSEQADTLTPAACVKSSNGRILVPETGEWLTLSENNGRIFFDALSCKGLLLDDNGGQLMLAESINDTQNIQCRTLSQWLTPTGNIDAVTGEYVVASADNAAFCTSLVTGLNRQSLSPNTLPITVRAFQDANEDYYRLAISEGVNQNSRKIFGVNQILSQNVTPKAIQWQDIYKEAVKIQFLNFIEVPRNDEPIIYAENYTETPVFTINGLALFSRAKQFTTQSINWWADRYMDVKDTAYFDEPKPDTNNIYNGSYAINRIHPEEVDKIYDHVDTDIYFIDPDTGQMSDIQHISFSVPNNIVMETIHTQTNGSASLGIPPVPYDYQDVSEESTLYDHFELVIHNHEVCISAVNYSTGEQVFFSVMSLPENVRPFTFSGVVPTLVCDNLALNGKKYDWYNDDEYLPANLSSYAMHLLFYERFSATPFAYDISSSNDWQTLSNNLASAFISFYPGLMLVKCHHGINVISNDSGTFSLVSLYVLIFFQFLNEKMFLLVFRAETNPDVFDFYSELERSNPQ